MWMHIFGADLYQGTPSISRLSISVIAQYCRIHSVSSMPDHGCLSYFSLFARDNVKKTAIAVFLLWGRELHSSRLTLPH